MNNPLVSIILPVYNGEKYLSQSISSCIEQTYKNIELIIIDDCSKDRSWEIAKEFQDQDDRIKIFHNSENRKLPASLNRGHNLASGNYLTWTSHDNIYHKEAIEKLVGSLVESKTDVVYSNYLTIDEKGELIDAVNLKDIEYLLFYGVIGACFLYTREFFERNKGYDEHLFLLEDFDFWLRGTKHGNFYKISNPGYYFYRHHQDALTAKINVDSERKREFNSKLQSLYDKILPNDEKFTLRDEIIYFLSNFRTEDKKIKMLPVLKKGFLKELNTLLIEFEAISSKKINRIILSDCTELILTTTKYQTFQIFFNLHIIAKDYLLRLTVGRYLALFKKCILKIR